MKSRDLICLFFLSTIFPVFGNQNLIFPDTSSTKKAHSLSSELLVFYDLSTLPTYLNGSICAQVSSYDTTGGNDDGFSGRFSYLRKNPDQSLVIFDQKGSGVINRIWTPTPNNDTLDFYIDNDVAPLFSLRFIDLFSGEKFPFVEPLCGNELGGYYCYVPIPFEKSCKIVSRGNDIKFHQIQYRLYEKGAAVKSFSMELNDEEKSSLKKIASLWKMEKKDINNFYDNQPTLSSKLISLVPGETVTIFEAKQGGRILGLEFSPQSIFEGLNKNIDIKITWDNEKLPAVFCPVADFFGYAFGEGSMQSLLLGSQDNKNYCYFPMPYDKKVRIELVYRENKNLPQATMQLSAKVWHSDKKRIPEIEGKLYAHWNKNILPPVGEPHVFLDVKGKGHYVGTILQSQGKKPGMTTFFEGDDSTSIDGAFRMHGTGSEDYFNGGWYAMMDRWDDKMSLPLHGALDYSLPLCRTGGYRLFLSDKISFEKSLFHSMEHGPVGNAFPVDYTSVALYYSDSAAEEVTVPGNELSKVFLPDTLTLYPQLMDFNTYGNIDIKTTWKYGTGGDTYIFTPGNESKLRIVLEEIPMGKHKVYFDFIAGPAGCDISLWQRQGQISEWISTYRAEEERERNHYLTDIKLDDIANTMTIRFKGRRRKSELCIKQNNIYSAGREVVLKI